MLQVFEGGCSWPYMGAVRYVLIIVVDNMVYMDTVNYT